MRLTKKAIREISDYKLNLNAEYRAYYTDYCNRLQNTIDRHGYKKLPLNTSDKNMIKALRMHAWSNSPSDWARLHAYEAFSR